MAKWQTFQENWASNSNTTGGLYSGFFGTTSISGNQCNYTISSGGLNYEGFDTAAYDLTDSYFFQQMVNAGNQSLASLQAFAINLTLDANNKLQIIIEQNNIDCIKLIGGVATTINSTGYNSAVHKWFRVKESNGTIYYDYSIDGIEWINLTTLAKPFAITSMFMELAAGVFASEATGTTVITGNINTVDTNRPGNLLNHLTVGDGMSRSEIAN